MKRALIVIASVGIFAVTVAMESANAQVTRPYRAPPRYAEPGPQGAGWNGLGQGYGWNGLGAYRTKYLSVLRPGQSGSYGRGKLWQ